MRYQKPVFTFVWSDEGPAKLTTLMDTQGNKCHEITIPRSMSLHDVGLLIKHVTCTSKASAKCDFSPERGWKALSQKESLNMCAGNGCKEIKKPKAAIFKEGKRSK